MTWSPCTSKQYTGSAYQVSQRYISVPLSYSSSVRSLNLYVRRFSKGTPLKHIFLVAGGPGQSGRVFESFVSNFDTYDDCLIYVVDHRGTGKSGKLSKGTEYAKDPESCPQAQELRHYSATNAARDLVEVVKIITSEDGGEAHAIASSYGTLVLYRAMRLMPNLFSGVLLVDFYPTFQPLVADMTPHWLKLCHEDTNCKARFPSLDAVRGLMKNVSKPGFNQCTRHLRSLPSWSHYGDSNNLGPLVQRFFGMTLEALTAQSENALLVSFALLYQLHKCSDPALFAQMISDLEQLFEREGLVNINRELAPRAGLVVAWFVENRFKAGSHHRNDLINNFINYSESHRGNFSSCLADTKLHLYSDCLSNSVFVQQRRRRFAGVAYDPEHASLLSLSTSARVIIVGGMIDAQTPMSLSELAASQISAGGGKLLLPVKHSAHGSLRNSGCTSEILQALLGGRLSAAESCVREKSRPLQWKDFPGMSQYLWPMNGMADLPIPATSGPDFNWKQFVAVSAVVLVIAALSFFLKRRFHK